MPVDLADLVSRWLADNPLPRLFLALVVLDVAMGTLRAIKDRALSSTVSTVGMLRKTGMLLLISMGELLEPYSPAALNLSEVVAAGFCLSEGISILENAARIGIPIPDALRATLAKLPTKGGEPGPTP